MNYPVKCSHCISQLKNCKAFKKAHYYKNNGEMYIDVQSVRQQVAISMLEYNQEKSLQAYKRLLELVGEEA